MIRPILSFTQEQAASAVVDQLSGAGIAAQLTEEHDKKKIVYTVSVDEPEHGRAIDLVAEGQFAAATVKCPGCASIAVEFPARARASGLVNAMSVLADTVLPPKEQSFVCLNCSNEWESARLG